ncbi:MAG: nitrilase-related carbon-nitrogen hydrolase [Rudaea sp.]
MLRAAVVQIGFSLASNPQELMDRMRLPVEQAASDGARLVLLPGYSGYGLLGLFAPDYPAAAALDLAALARAQGLDSAAALVRTRGPLVLELYLHVLQSLAERTGVWLAGGTAPEVAGEDWYNTCFVFMPDGQLAGKQRQTHRSPQERAWGMSRGDELQLTRTDAARVGLVVGSDLRYPEVSRILAMQGANVLAFPSTENLAGQEQFLQDAWREVQSNQVFGLLAAPGGAEEAARSAIYAPVEMTPDRSGILARASSAGEQVVMADLDFEALQRVVDEYPLFDLFNYELYRGLSP